jgi:manganese efflux pump family protein
VELPRASLHHENGDRCGLPSADVEPPAASAEGRLNPFGSRPGVVPILLQRRLSPVQPVAGCGGTERGRGNRTGGQGLSFVEVLLVALGLAMDAFAVALAAGASGRAGGARAAFRLSFHFGLFQFLMPVLGWFGGSLVARRIERLDHWIAFGLLAWIGGRMVKAGSHDPENVKLGDPSKGMSLVMLSVATSIDALAIGLSIGMLRISVWYPAVIIGIVAAAMTLAGLRLGRRLGLRFGQRMELVGGLVLIGIGTKILLEHLL